MICYLHYCAKADCADLHGLAGPALRRDELGAPAVITFKPAQFEHMYNWWERVPTIDTPEKLRQECVKRGVTSNYLAESLLWRSGETRWV